MKQEKKLHHGVHRGHGVNHFKKLHVLCVLRGESLLEAFALTQITPLADGQIAQHHIADADAFQAQHF